MKKTTLFAFAAALAMTSNIAAAQEHTEIIYSEDASQGLLINPMQDNWFITGEVGANLYLSPHDSHRKLFDRFAPAGSLYVGKWFTPQFGARIGVNFVSNKGLSEIGGYLDEPSYDGYYKERWNHVGPVFDVMANLTNIICGYNPNRVYNASIYAGGGAYLPFARTVKRNADGTYNRSGYKLVHDDVLTVRLGLLNQFRVSKRWQINLDLRWTPTDAHPDIDAVGSNRTANNIQLYAGATYNFGSTTIWSPAVVPVITEEMFENCDALHVRLDAADARISDLEEQLNDCLNRPVVVEKEVEVIRGPLATVYFPIGVSKLSQSEINVLEAIAQVMNANPDKKYVVTGWADNYTGSDDINTRLRKARAESVERQLVKFGVKKSQLTVTTNSGNLCDLGDKYVALDRAVTIDEE